MSTFYIVLAATAAGAHLFSGVASMMRLKIIYPLLERVGVPGSWLVFPIGVAKTAGGLGLLAGLLGPHWIGVAAAGGLVLFWTCAIFAHLRADFWPKQTPLIFVFTALAAGTLAVGLV
ncbi:DoxX family protein [Glycomyces salinus]|uniref:DoxX family protein n=1 Tax=Glycomyces salinus TaxID=980294 RepID=UPI0018EE2BA4|nr:DoxX family protein [Glycomyces salinus]